MIGVSLVSSGGEGDAAAEWVRRVPGVSLTRAAALGEVLLDATDVLWVHGECEVGWEASLLGWLSGGGRLLATLEGVRLLYALGLEPIEPPGISEGDRPGGLRGLGAFGSHPLFARLDAGPFIHSADSKAVRGCLYSAAWPVSAQVVAVDRLETGLDQGRAVAWEQRVADGGALCIGAHIHLTATDADTALRLRAMLTNAIAGDAIPHRDRATGAATWPGADVMPAEREVPAMPPLGGAIEACSAGGRMHIGQQSDGLLEGWSQPFRLFHGAGARAAGTAATVAGAWATALELPLFVWDVPPGSRARWTIDLRRPPPYAAGAFGKLSAALSVDATRLLVYPASAPVSALFGVEGGRMTLTRPDPFTVEVECVGSAVRVVGIAATDAADLDRTLDLLGRRGIEGFGRQRVQHVEQIMRGGSSIEVTGDDGAGKSFDAAKLHADALLAGVPGLAGPLELSHACWAAIGLLAAGLHEAPRRLLRFLAGIQDVTGRIPDRFTTNGFACFAGSATTSHFLLLAARHAAWTGDLELQAELKSALDRASIHAGPAGQSSTEAAPLLGAVHSLWGIEPDAPAGIVRLRPRLPPRASRMSLSRLRVGRTALNLSMRRRGPTIQVLIRRATGPRIGIDCEVSGVSAQTVALDGEPVGSPRVRFEASEAHELTLHVAE